MLRPSLTFRSLPLIVAALLATLTLSSQSPELLAQEGTLEIPRRQSKPPGPPLSPEEALKEMTVPDGFRVELVAAEPDIMNPVAMAFDERGRIWITESFEYPRHEPGPGRDRIKILEDTTGDGNYDSVKVFADGLNIPSGIAVGHGGVWVANAPDLLFMQDTDGDDRADKTEVVVTGFGRHDTHELPNSLTWGPDGNLYGLNGVFNPCRVESDGEVYEFTCAMFRVDPRTRKFDLFCEGTSNPWGITFDNEGSAFISACVIDHLWHLTETGYYHRQGGPYPPHTWKIDSIVEHKHQMAAYCGITYFDSPAYPVEYRDRLIMGNIHGNCLNVDRVQRSGSTYRGFGEDDFLSGNDVWFMPVAQKVGPDGCLYVLDWYDRYHCYQDASADPEGVDRSHGRLYRIVHEETGRPEPTRLAESDAAELVERLTDPNIHLRQTAQRLLAERNCAGVVEDLEAMAVNAEMAQNHRLHAIWSLLAGEALTKQLVAQLLADEDAVVRAWGVRAAGNRFSDQTKVGQQLADLADDSDPRVQLQVAIAMGKFASLDPLPVWMRILETCGNDQLLPHIVWQNLHPHLPAKSAELMQLVEGTDIGSAPGVAAMLPKVAEKLQDSK
jgi:putative membrane-bound dehydrogenase-like protein